MLKKYFNVKSLVVIIVSIFIVAGVVQAASTIINNFYGNSTINQSPEQQIGDEIMIGSVDAIGGICDGSEPTTQLCNVNVYDISSQNGISNDAGESVFNNLRPLGAITSINLSTTTNTLTAAQVCDSIQIEIATSTGTLAPITVALPATTTLFADCLTANGMGLSFDYVNTSATSTTILAGAGIDLESDDASGNIIATTDTGRITCIRTSSTVARCTIDSYTNAD